MEINWITMMPTESDFDFWIENKYNVLLIGGHGIGKTSLITKAFNRHNLNHRYFSASTMDPWVDFIGVPKEVKDDEGEYLELIKPKEFRDNKVNALFFDEFNRAHPKVQNAVMELIQFKSINGKKFGNLDIVWAAINDEVDDVEYNTDKLDYAQLDRFHVIVKLPSKPQVAYFRENHGKQGEIAVKWWNELSDDLKKFISPRRLDYILEIYKNGGNIEYSLPANANVKTLVSNLKQGLPLDAMIALINNKDETALKSWLANEINLGQVTNDIIKDYIQECFRLLSTEKQSELISKYDKVKNYVNSNGDKFKKLVDSLRTSKDKKMRSWALSVKCSGDDALIASARSFAKWEPTKTVAYLKKEAATYSLCFWKYERMSSSLELLNYTTEDNKALDAVIDEIAPKPGEYYVTTKKLQQLKKVFKTISDSKTIGNSQVATVLYALNYWGSGLQHSTMQKVCTENKSSKKIVSSLLAKYIVEKQHQSLTPEIFFDSFQVLYLFYKEIGLKWT
jgi:hypothetical protein